METSDDSSSQALDIIYILLATVVRPIDQPFQSQPYPIADHQRHIYSVTVTGGTGVLSSGSPISRAAPEYEKQVATTDDDCPDFVKEISTSLKQKTEEVNDIVIREFVLQFGLRDGEDPTLLGCAGSTFAPSPQLEPFASSIAVFTLFYAAEASVNPIASQCITRGRFCSGGTSSIERSKIVSYHISCIAQSIKTGGIAQYLKSRINALCPVIMMANVSVCSACFKFYSVEATQPKKMSATTGRECSAATLRDHNRSLIVRKEQRPATTFAKKNSDKTEARSSLPLIRPPQAPYQIGNLTASGLRITSDRSTIANELAKRTYRGSPFILVPPPKPDPKFIYRPKSTNLK